MISKMFKVLPWLLVAILIACSDVGERVREEFDHSGRELTITIYEYDTKGELNQAYKDYLGKEYTDELDAQGLRSGWSEWGGSNRGTIHVQKIDLVDDTDKFKTWGHELYHIVHGKFHK